MTHPALQAILDRPNLSTIELNCGCGRSWWIPVKRDTHQPDTEQFGQEILSCPDCGTTHETQATR